MPESESLTLEPTEASHRSPASHARRTGRPSAAPSLAAALAAALGAAAGRSWWS